MKAYSSVRLFKNPLLEALTHVHPSLPFLIWIPVVFYFAAQGLSKTDLSVFSNLSLIGFGIVFWTLTEYAMHRYVFHFEAKSKAGNYLVFLFHGIHHDDPQDPTRLVMPPVVSIFLGFLFYSLFKLVMGPQACMPFFSGFIAGYLVYDYIHFATHHFMFKGKWFKTLKENHMKHHFLAKQGKWGVSSPFWDYVFGSFKQE